MTSGSLEGCLSDQRSLRTMLRKWGITEYEFAASVAVV